MISEQRYATPETDAGGRPEDPPATGVVVGVDDSQSARAAVAWAATAAERRGVGLHLVEVLPGSGGSSVEPEAPQGRAWALLSRAADIARSVSPDLAVSTHTLHGRVAPALVGYAVEASLLVVGSNGPGGPVPLSLGSIVGGVTRRCACPVVLVPAGTPRSAPAGPVVVALDDTPDGRRALTFAAAVAARRDVALVPLVSSAESGLDDALLADVRRSHPDLAVQPQSITERPAQALLRSDADAQLIVVPSVRRSTAGWTGHFLPLLSACPVAVVSEPTSPSGVI